ncbi:cytochrome c [Rhodobacteraceae bacterium CCMM004]|nr:cytochrome c [Rhodobacteraceae bacterium CCMM004]
MPSAGHHPSGTARCRAAARPQAGPRRPIPRARRFRASPRNGASLGTRHRLARAAALALAALWAASATASEGGVDPARLERLVLQDCGSCHGLTRKGGLGSDLRREALAHWDAAALAEVILDGIPGTAMPAWRPIMTEDEAAWIARYLLTVE